MAGTARRKKNCARSFRPIIISDRTSWSELERLIVEARPFLRQWGRVAFRCKAGCPYDDLSSARPAGRERRIDESRFIATADRNSRRYPRSAGYTRVRSQILMHRLR